MEAVWAEGWREGWSLRAELSDSAVSGVCSKHCAAGPLLSPLFQAPKPEKEPKLLYYLYGKPTSGNSLEVMSVGLWWEDTPGSGRGVRRIWGSAWRP